MGRETSIEWTHHTFSPWRGCSKVHTGCTHCYAEKNAARNPRIFGEWGDNGTRVIASEAMWREPMKWNRAAEAAGEQRRVFCASLADVFEDRPELEAPRRRLFDLIERTPWLTWLLLTKRPGKFAREAMAEWEQHCRDHGVEFPRERVWIGGSIADQRTTEDILPHLMDLRQFASVLFVSYEPAIGPVDLTAVEPYFLRDMKDKSKFDPIIRHNVLTGLVSGMDEYHAKIDWVICGGESGPNARPCDVAWIRSIVQQCQAAGTACFVKQLGGNPRAFNPRHQWYDGTDFREGGVTLLPLSDRKGGDPEEWCEDLRVREFPKGRE